MNEARRSPALRARWTQQLIGPAAGLAPDQRARLEGRVGATKLVYLDGLDTLDWVPADDHIEILQALLEVLGPAEFVAVIRRAGVETMRSPFLRTIAVAGVKMFGRSALLRVLPRAWRVSLRNCGRLRVLRDAEAGITTLIVSELPRVFRESEAWRLALAATFAATLDLGGYIGRVRVDEGTYHGDELRFIVSLIVEPENDPSEGHCGGSANTRT